MSFTDTLKRSLGFEETESGGNNGSEGFNLNDFINNFKKPQQENQQQANSQQQNKPNPQTVPNPTVQPDPVWDDDDFVIIPEQSFYEIILIRPKSIDDVNYVVDQVVGERNPVILDLSFLQKESPANYKLAGDKIKKMKAKHGVQALLLARSDEKCLIIVSPKKVKVINKG